MKIRRIPKLRPDSVEKERARCRKLCEESLWNFARFSAILLGQLPCVVAYPEGVDLFFVMQPLTVEFETDCGGERAKWFCGRLVQG
jgi:hypothetical protein